jgi:hypothetical protein
VVLFTWTRHKSPLEIRQEKDLASSISCAGCLPDATPENSRKAPSFFQGGGWGWCCSPGRGIRVRREIRQEKDLASSFSCAGYLPDATPENSRKAPSFFQGGGWGWCCSPGRGIRVRREIRQEKDLASSFSCAGYLPDATPENSLTTCCFLDAA